MDATHKMFCNKELVNPLNSMGMQVSCILVVSHFFNVVLRTVGQPGPIAQILVELDINAPMPSFCMVIMLVVAYTSSPMVIRLTGDLRFAASDVGRIAVSAALITEMGCLLFFNVMNLDTEAYNVLLVAIVINTIISGVIVSFLARGEERMFSNIHTAVEPQDMDDELRILACVYDPRQVSAILATVLAIHGSKASPSTTYLMHLIELVKKIKSNLLFHEKDNADLSDDDDYGGNDVVEINNSLDAFTADTKILVHQRRAVSSFPSLYEDVCNEAEDLQVSIILLPFHKHQRIDGKLESGKEGIRITNQKVLRHAPCSIGVIIERGLAKVPGFSQLIASENTQNVATLFFGGPDDREAIAWSLRISKCSRINLTIIRFLLSSSSSHDEHIESGINSDEKEILMSLSGEETVNEIDNTFMVDFYNRYVASGQIGYVEKFVQDGTETVESLKEIGDMYSLFIVGRGGRGNSSLTIGMSDWEECPELGTVGDVLASSDFDIHGSVLVIQQHRDAKKGIIND
ncbi:hypothetical protein TSUD_308570 [Trifolium subterraneum]|nr:hypothetical protein TSUD_308570 [Trifolium subterraneum]